MICDFPQIQGGQQISIFIINLLASPNLLEKTKFTKGNDSGHIWRLTETLYHFQTSVLPGSGNSFINEEREHA